MSTHNRSENLAVVQSVRRKALVIEPLLSLYRLSDISYGADIFTTKEPPRCPPWARGAYGGQLIAQALLAAYETVPANFVVHSIHCHFLAPAKVDSSVFYSVEHACDGRSFASRFVHAKQEDKLVLSATASFSRDESGRPTSNVWNFLHHGVPMPNVGQPPADDPGMAKQSAAGQAGEGQPCDCVRLPVNNNGLPSERKLLQWIRARCQSAGIGAKLGTRNSGRQLKDSEQVTKSNTTRDGGVILPLQDSDNEKTQGVHAAALAYMSDNYFIGTVFRVHNATRFSNRSPPCLGPVATSATDEHEYHGEALQRYIEALVHEEIEDNRGAPKNDKQVEMMVTLNHAIFFHSPHHFHADEWMLAEMESPWAGDERGIVLQRIWSRQGTLVATCIQEGVIRLSQHASKGRL